LLAPAIPSPPATIPLPSFDSAQLLQTFLNTSLGDCVIADHGHFLAGITAGAGKAFTPTDAQIQTDYSSACGYIPGDPFSDQGCDIPTVLAYYQSTGFADGSKLLGSTDIDATNQTAVQQAIWIAGGVCFGVGLPDAWINNAPQASGFTWDVAGNADQMNGHCFEGFGYTAQGVLIATWGMWGTITWKAVAEYASATQGGELHTRVNPEMVNATTGLSPGGLTLNQICTYFNAMGGNVVVPPGPTPTPTPGPVSVNVPFGVYNLTITGTAVTPTPPTIVVPDPATVTVCGQSITIAATLASK